MNTKNIEKIESQTFRRLISHLQSRTEVQNIDIMNLTGFCRNCLYKWMHEAARESDEALSVEEAQEYVYGMPYDDWKKKFSIFYNSLFYRKNKNIEHINEKATS